jgi:cyclopropane fatty-acyl-phospholipid synthase-like methyltransferase
VAVATDAANRQHYELPPEFFGEVLGPRRKYSCGLYPMVVRDLATADMNHFATSERFDRVIWVEMFEHMHNCPELLRHIHSWLKDGGRVFVHIFCRRELAYLFETEGTDNWMGRAFFIGGIMPSDHLLFYFNEHLVVEYHWRVSGSHYQQTCEDWLRLMDDRSGRIRTILEKRSRCETANNSSNG